MAGREQAWCVDCGWVAVRVPVDGGGAYWCGAASAPIEGPVIWRPACARYRPKPSRMGAGAPAGPR